jgi:2-haloacid dehalogenase
MSQTLTHSSFSDIKACVFDAYGTLFDLGSLAERFRFALGPKAEPLMELWRRKQLEYSWLRSLMGRHTDFWHVTGEALDFAMEAQGLSDPSLRSRLMEAWLAPKVYPEALGVLRALQHSDRRTAILSNGSPSMLTAGLSATGLGKALDAVLSVEKVGTYKPHPSVYKLASDRFDVDPRQVCFVSGNGWDVAGAAAFGFTVAWVNRSGAAVDNLPAGPAAIIGSLSELPALLGV